MSKSQISNHPPRYVFLTNIPTPYRVAFYNSLALRDNFVFSVCYMRETEADRSWSTKRLLLKHEYVIDNGFYKMFGRYHLHINPTLIFGLWRLPESTEVIIGGAWNDVNVLIIVLLKRVGLFKRRLHFWSEANYLTLGASNDNIIKKFLRKFVYNCADGVQLSSGRMTEITLEQWGININQLIRLPNTIDEVLFDITEDSVRCRSSNQPPVFLIVARIHEIVKGIINFFDAIGRDNIKLCRFVVAGNGPDEADLREFILSNNYSNYIQLVGHCDDDKISHLYRIANVLVLGSYTDASPLVVVEALRMRLPLLISERCGNHFEACHVGINGYLFNPYDQSTIREAFEVLLKRRNEWFEMGQYSYYLYNKFFKMDMVIDNFANEMNAFCSIR